MTVYTPASVLVSNTTHKPAEQIGGAAGLGDDSDATYSVQWYSVRSSAGTGPTLRAYFDPLSGYVWELLRMRFQVYNANGGTGTHLVVTCHSQLTGDLIGNFYRPGDSDAITEVAALDTIYDYNDWAFEQVDPNKSLSDGLAEGLLVQVRRNPFVGTTLTPLESNGDYGVRVYELTFGVAVASTATGIQPRRIFQRPL